MAAFGFVQHNFFILFNALIGLAFLRECEAAGMPVFVNPGLIEGLAKDRPRPDHMVARVERLVEIGRICSAVAKDGLENRVRRHPV